MATQLPKKNGPPSTSWQSGYL